jgi:hypothetical protein
MQRVLNADALPTKTKRRPIDKMKEVSLFRELWKFIAILLESVSLYPIDLAKQGCLYRTRED